MMKNRWANKVGHGYTIQLSEDFVIKVVTWRGHGFTEILLIRRDNILSARLGYSQTETDRHIETAKDEFQTLAARQKRT